MKSFWKSKTIWVNIILAVLGVVAEVSQVFPISQNPKVWVTITAVLNIILRTITTQPLAK